MKDDVKAKIKVLDYLVACAKHASRAKDPRERLAAVELEVEFTDRITRLRTEDREPEFQLAGGVEHPEGGR